MTTTENDLVEAMAETMLEYCGQGSSRHDAPSWLAASIDERLRWRDLARAGLSVVRAHDDERDEVAFTRAQELHDAMHASSVERNRAIAGAAIAARFAARCWAALDSAGRAEVDRTASPAERTQFGCLTPEEGTSGIVTEPALTSDGGPAT